ncbi:hypothetical protein SmJEL517_g00226 [Synchytrium microbalum]|uniref:HECT-type E3 ubiquitin transferase n=1 Tax=Synchytrium microbalum TaxID=1806994 RepID=A0A507CFR0_9FUNG|nr:uncharacterized protein SmJEL517_g00226 [Synchytrium microbalum]TPX38198.1 hypothetical protein SmJEL517_g00226 [Synchytrium microbalum]
MAKIKKQLPRRLAPAPAAVLKVIDLLTNASDVQLIDISKQLHLWCHPKSDFYHWIPVLNRFDSILESAMPVKGYDVASDGFGPAESPDSPSKQVILAVLNITRHLWETCTNRNLYNSFEHLIDLLNTRDLDILTSTLRLMLRPAQRTSAQRSIRSTMSSAHERLMVLSQNLGGASDLANISQTDTPMTGSESSSLTFQFYRTATKPKKVDTSIVESTTKLSTAAPTTTTIPQASSSSIAAPTAIPSASSSSATTLPGTTVSTAATPIKVSKLSTKLPATPSDKKADDISATEGLVVIQIPDVTALGPSEKVVLQLLVKQYDVPEEHTFALFHRLRIAFAAQDAHARHSILLSRILAIGTLANLVSEESANTKIFSSDAGLVQKLVDVLPADCSTDLHVASLMALESLAKYRNKQNEILTAMNASANHGVLMFLVRKLMSKLSEDVSETSQDFMDAITAFISYVITTQAGGNMVISAGLVPALVAALNTTEPKHLKNVTKIIGILDSLLHGFGNSFASFANANGLTLLTTRIKDDVALALEISGVRAPVEGGMEVDTEIVELPYERSSLLRAMLKFVFHMMQTSGGQDGLRNLVDSSLPASLITIFDHAMLFGPSVFGLAANIMATFIHNEATVLSILQEAKLPQSFLKAIKNGFPVSAEVVSAIPNALGALCLNEQGLNAVLEAEVFDRFCSVFTEEQYQSALHDGEVPNLVGSSFDELMRHTPALKPQITTAIVKMLKAIVDMGKAMHIEDEGGNINLMVNKGSPDTASSSTEVPETVADASGDVTMMDATVVDATVVDAAAVDGKRDEAAVAAKDAPRDSKISQFVETVSRFVEGVLTTQEHGAKLIELGALPILLDIYSLPSVPYDFGSSSASYSLSYLFRILIEADTKAVIEALLGAIRRSLERLSSFLTYDGNDAMVSSLIELWESNPEQVDTASTIFRSLVEIHGYMKLLSDIYGTHTVGPGKGAVAIIHTFASKESEGMLKALVHLQSVCSWEHTLLRKSVPKSWFQPKNKKNADKAGVLPSSTSMNVLSDAADQAAATSSEGAAAGGDDGVDMKDKDPRTEKKARNVRLFAFLLSRVSTLLGPIFFGVVKLVTARRIADANHRKSAYKVIDMLVSQLVEGLNWQRALRDESLQTVQYLTMSIARLTHVLSDDRSGNVLQTSAAFAFKKTGGMESLLKVAEYLWNKVEQLPPADDKVVMTKENTDPAVLLLQDVLEIIKLLTNHKALLESPHTANLVLIYPASSETPFLAHEMLVQNRLAVLPHILVLWRSDLLSKVPSNLVRLVVNILLQILRATGEVSPTVVGAAASLPNGTGALQSFSNAFFGAGAPTQAAPDPERVQQLTDMGFPRGAAETALTRYSNNISRATEYLISHPEIVAAERSRPTPTATAATATAAGVGAAAAGPADPQVPAEAPAAEPPTVANPPSDPMTQDNDEGGDEEDDNEAAQLAAALAMSVQARTDTDAMDVTVQNPAVPSAASPVLSHSPQPDENGKAKASLTPKAELDALRAEAMKDAVDRALTLLQIRDSAIFELKDVLMFCAIDNMSWIERIMEGMAALFTSAEISIEAASAKARELRLLALLLNEAGLPHTTVLDAVKPLVKEFLSHTSNVVVNEQSTAWLPPILLLVSQYLSQAEEPRKVKLNPDLSSRDADMNNVAPPPVESLTLEERANLLHLMVRLLRNETVLPKALLSAVLPLVVQLTRKAAEAVSFVELGGLAALFQSDRIALVAEQPTMTVIVLRNIVENPEVLLIAMERELRVWFGTPRTRATDIGGYLRAVAGIACRDPETFIKATENIAHIPRYEALSRQQQITLKTVKPADAIAAEDGAPTSSTAMEVEGLAATTTPAAASASSKEPHVAEVRVVDRLVVGYMVSELLAMRPAPNAEPLKPEAKKQVYRRRIVLLQSLTELVSSYPAARAAAVGIVADSDIKASPTPAGSAFLSYLLDELVPNAVKSPEEDNVAGLSDEVMESCWGLTLLQELCGGSITDIDKEGVSQALDVAVRKLTLEAIKSSINDVVAQSDGSRDDRYALFALLAELVDRILLMRVAATDRTGRLANRNTPDEAGANDDDNSNSLTRIMLDKGFVGALTSMIAEIDIHHPKSKLVVQALLKPIEVLTKAATRVPKPPDAPGKLGLGGAAAAAEEAIPIPILPEGVATDMPVDDTSDIYRNSALGIFNAEHNAEHDVSDDTEDDEDDGGEEDYDSFDGEGEEVSDADMHDEHDEDDDDDNGSNPDDDMEITLPYHQPHDHMEDEDEEEDDEDDDGPPGPHGHGNDNAIVEVIEGEDGGPDDASDWVDEDAYLDAEHDHDHGIVEPFGENGAAMNLDEGDEHDEGDGGDEDDEEDDEDEGGIILDDDGEETEEDDPIPPYLAPLDAFDLQGAGEEDFEALELQANRPLGGMAGRPGQAGRIAHRLFGGRRRRAPLDFDADGPMGADRFIFEWRDQPDPGYNPYGHPFPTLPRTAPRHDDRLTHPLLLNDAEVAQNERAADPRGLAARARGRLGDMQIDFQAFDDLVGGQALQILQQIFARGAGGAAAAARALRAELPIGGAVGLPNLLVPPGAGLGALPPHVSPNGTLTSAAAAVLGTPESEQDSIVRSYNVSSTMERWTQQARILYRAGYPDRALRLQNHILNALIPEAMEEERKRKEKSAELRRILEENERVEAEKRRVEEEEAAAKAAKAAEEAAAIAAAAAAAAPVVEPVVEPATVPMDADQPAAVSVEPPAPAAEIVRTIVTIHGREVDITGTGIDPEFLEALPDDMRQEVVAQHLRENRQQARTSASATMSAAINPEFLDALPPDIRQEILEQEQLEAARATRAREGATAANAGGPIEMDPATFLATLDPDLRQNILLEQDDVFLSRLPPGLLAEATHLRERLNRNRHIQTLRAHRALAGSPAAIAAEAPKKKLVSRDVMQVVDRSQLSMIVRLLFLPEPVNGKNLLLHKILANLAENAKTRLEVVSLLLSLLADGTGDLTGIERSFSQSGRVKAKTPVTPRPPSTAGTPMASPFAAPSVPNHSSNNTVSETSATTVAVRCLDALTHLVQFNNQVAHLFLMESEAFGQSFTKSSRMAVSNRKGKGKEKAAHKLPVLILFSLLERKTFLGDSSIMESLMHLLSLVVRPLAILGNRKLSTVTEPPTTTQTNPPAASGEGAAATNATTEAPATTTSTTADPSTLSITTPSTSTSSAPVPDPRQAQINLLEKLVIPEPYIQASMNVLTAGECSSKTFQSTLQVIQQLAALGDNRQIMARQAVQSAQTLGDTIYGDLDELCKILKTGAEVVQVQAAILGKLSSSSSQQAKLLRLLKTIDVVFSKKQTEKPAVPSTTPAAPTTTTATTAPSTEATGGDTTMADASTPAVLNTGITTPTAEASSEAKEDDRVDKDTLISIYDQLSFARMWAILGEVLSIIDKTTEYVQVATVLLPLIEAFMVVSKPYVLKKSSNVKASAMPMPPGVRLVKELSNVEENETFLKFTGEHRKILNVMVRNNPSLMNGSFSLLIHNPNVLEFDNKRTYFNQQLHKRTARDHYGTLEINVRRPYVFDDSYHQLQRHSGEEIKYGKLSVRFVDEEGIDAGGVTREWFGVLTKQMFNPNYALFKPSAADKVTYQPNRSSWINGEHLTLFKFVGRIIGKAIYDGKLLECFFTRSFYKCMLEVPVDWRDMEAIDPDFHKSLEWMLNNDITNILDLNFSSEVDDFGKTKVIDLKPNGQNIAVTEDNKQEYVKLITEQKLTVAIKDQIQAFLSGFHDIIPKDLIKIFNEQELELLISGLPDIDIDDMKAHTEYVNYAASSPQIQWFWRAVRSFSQEERAKLVQFVTGTSKVPLEGFAQLQGSNGVQRFQIHKDFANIKRLPSAHTCFNQIDLPAYDSYENLRSNLLLAISECGTGFGFA